MTAPQIVWFRRDLRLRDQAALCAAAENGAVIPVYILDDETPGNRKMGGASRWWLHNSLSALQRSLAKHNSRLILRRGESAAELARLVEETGAKTIHAIAHYEPWWREAEKKVAQDMDLALYDGNYLMPPGSLTTGSGDPYKIFTPFYRAMMRALPQQSPREEPSLTLPENWPKSDSLESWTLLPSAPDWAGGMRKSWEVGEDAAHAQLADFGDRVSDYENDRNLPSIDGSSRLSPHLHFGEITPAQIWSALEGHRGEGAETYRSEIAWRDFAQNIIFQFPHYPDGNYRDRYDDFPWRNPNRGHVIAEELEAWQMGKTGYPIVDAGMRQLWATGWMHNRVRMIAASFLIKHLLIDWRHGEEWFWDTLVDADYGSNATNWQWVSGTGVDSQMFPRIMAPLSQSEKFNAADYIREWVPELAALPDKDIHDPSGDKRPHDYPEKLIGHKEARERALDAYRQMKGE
ncbi:cryptochrome/photolyase family protein [Altericroceibacterium endophyticum]|uniref:Deoxyribodipyrimidine photo-lyase n=1 Tax=Altericroceibacterium endophyticum TaxID=1808508 RepID=A0A6I4T1C0_9SPHN|nr:deoxyribodipyrimidine photo-lyase [Altericroceibacterium endophyticum]MXO64678.1 deoxyribodipyrimidine photo-lyase [Altericroceibacterium endophyticum]